MPDAKLPASVSEKISGMGESSYGAHRVSLVMRDGRVIENVSVAWTGTVVQIDGSVEFELDPAEVIDVVPGS